MAEDQSGKWDFFIAHAGEDLKVARKLYDKLKEHARVFLDDECLDPGDPWDVKLPEAQRQSHVTIVLISQNTNEAYYEREEIAEAIDIARDTNLRHRLVPIYLEDPEEIDVPYGLRRRKKLVLDELGLDGVVERLRDLLPGVLRETTETRPSTRRRRRTFLTDYRVWLAVVLLVGAIGLFLFKDTLFSSGKDCIAIEHLSPNKIPHYLLNSVGSKNFPYWLKIMAKNNCSGPRRLKIHFESGENVSLDPSSRSFTIYENEMRPLIVKPKKFALLSQTTHNVVINWTVKDEVDKIILADSIDSEIIPPYTIYWGLQKPVKPNTWEPVEESYILASFSAWMKPTIDTSAKVTEKCWGLGVDFRGAVETCYDYLFHDNKKITVREALFRFPIGETERLRISPGKEIVGHDAIPLEAALFFVSVMSNESRYKVGTDPPLILFIAPPTENQELKTTYIAWQSTDENWEAIDFMHANSKRFQENLDEASPRINSIYKSVAAIKETLQSKQGAGFVEGKIYAVVDYAKARTECSIHGLP